MGKYWDKFLLRIGVCPLSFFEGYVHDSMKVFNSIEKFSCSTNVWANVVSEKIGIKFPVDNEVREKGSKDKGMYG